MIRKDLIYVGIDLHKDTHTAVIIDCFNNMLGEITFSNTPNQIINLLNKETNKWLFYAVENPRKSGLNRMQLGKDAEVQTTRWTRKYASGLFK